MAKIYTYRSVGRDCYVVSRVNDKYRKGDKRRYTEYLVDLKTSEWMCDCPHYLFTKKICKHIKFVISQLQDGGGIIQF